MSVQIEETSTSTLVETLPRSIHELFWSESVMYFQRRCRLKLYFLPYGPMLTTKKKKKEKTNRKKIKILKNKMSGDIVEIYFQKISTKFSIKSA